MPGFELIGQEEHDQINEIFQKSKILFRHGFDHLRNDVYKVRDFEKAFARKMDVDYALAVTSGSSALLVALKALGIDAGDEVITQSFTFVATVEAIIEAKATPVIVEIDKTLNMDPDDLERKITSKTKAILVVHMLGTPARLDKIKAIADKYNIFLVEDTAWGCGGFFENQALGTYGDIGTFSFDFAKTMTTGEGGMVVTKYESLYRKAAAYHDHGHENNPEFPRWEDTRSGSGFNYRMTELQGAVGIAQLKKLDGIVEKQRENKDKIWNFIKDLSGIELRECPEKSYETADALIFYVEDSAIASAIRKAMLASGFGTKILPEAVTWHFAGTWDHMPELVSQSCVPLKDRFPQSKELLNRAVSLPIMVHMQLGIESKIRKALESVLVAL